MGSKGTKEKTLELITRVSELDPARNRLCVVISDLHMTDGTVGFQNLDMEAWNRFYGTLSARCQAEGISEVTVILDGDVTDMLRSSQWAENGVYPWERERKEAFSAVVRSIIRDIVEKRHADFFQWLRELPGRLQGEAGVETVKTVLLLGNHDKELLSVPDALAYFYERGLGWKLADIPEDYRRAVGRMYGDETQFLEPSTAPYPLFYYGDCGFRLFVTHGQWRDKDNNRAIQRRGGQPGWKTADGWQIETWQQLHFTPFLLPCFGDTVAAGALSTFISTAKKNLSEHGYTDPRLDSILDELDLYRPTYSAILRIIKETKAMRQKGHGAGADKIIEDTLYSCVMEWLGWDFTYISSPRLRRTGLKIARFVLRFAKWFGHRLEIQGIAAMMMILNAFSRWHAYNHSGLSYKQLKSLPPFLPAYRHYGFQIHGEGHTHIPLEEEPNFGGKWPSSYINFGTWRDRIVRRKKQGYRRRGVLRAFYITDLAEKDAQGSAKPARVHNYFTSDTIQWGDKADSFNRTGQRRWKV